MKHLIQRLTQHSLTKKTQKYLDQGFATLAILFIRGYQITLSPDKGLPSLWLKGRICAHEPHCSAYGIQVFRRYGFIKGLWYSMVRVSSCTPSHDKIPDPSHYRVVFFSSATIGVPYLQALATDKRYELVGVVTAPDQPMGRGMKIKPNPIKVAAQELGLTDTQIQTPQSINPNSKYQEKAQEGKQFTQRLESVQADFLVVIAYGKIMPQSILDIPRVAPINVHGSLLPRRRGASPLQSVFLAGDEQTGVDVMVMEAGLDTGPIIGSRKTHLPLSRTVKDLIQRLQQPTQTKFLGDMMRDYAKGERASHRQDNTHATHCTKIAKEDGLIDPHTDTLETIYRKYQAYALRPKIFFILNEQWNKNTGKSATDTSVIIETITLDETLREQHKNTPLITQDPDTKTQDGLTLNPAVTSLTLKPAGKKTMNRQSFINGYK